MIEVIAQEVIVSGYAKARTNQSFNIDDFLMDTFILMSVCGALVILRPKHEQPLVFSQGLNQTNRWLNATHAREVTPFLVKHNLRDNASVAMDYAEMQRRTTYNIQKCTAVAVLKGGATN